MSHSPHSHEELRLIYHRHLANWRLRSDVPAPWCRIPPARPNIAPAPKEPLKEGETS